MEDEDGVTDSNSNSDSVFENNDDDDLFNTDDHYDDDDDNYDQDTQDDKEETEMQSASNWESEHKYDAIQSIEIVDKFVEGEYCHAAKKNRQVTVHISCCEESKEIQKLYNQHAEMMSSGSSSNSGGGQSIGGVFGTRYNGGGEDTRSEDVKKAPIIFHKIEEKQICEYTATICTTLVCNSMIKKWMSTSSSEMLMSSSSSSSSVMSNNKVSSTANRPTDSKRGKDGRKSVTSSPNNDEFPFAGSSANEMDVGKFGNVLEKKQLLIHRDDSIRDILDKALGGVQCLSMNAGWWTYGFCHKTQIFQFHEDVSLDALTAKANTKIDSRYLLGKYDKKLSEGFPVEEEIKQMHRPYSKHNDENDDNDDFDDDESGDGTKTNTKTSKKNNGNAEMADAYFVQEYLHGDTCEGSDVVDSAIKGGKFGDGKIERSTTVRFFCGSQKAIIRVDEDSTCHYVMDISVPELCVQKYFEVPHLQTQVVKCLPVN
mmetsp:Transcript_2377/g.3404  ORF Transcript_2377/g.3404 Transcript_2377/m.3404 type:complete len:484 (+) Transcript_2377:122-1573(+)